MVRIPLVLLVACLGLARAQTPAAVWTPDLGEDAATAVLLVTSEALAESWQPFAEWKTRCGKPTTIVTVEAIEKSFEGVDIQARIRACVLAYVAEHGTRWVILGGDSGKDGQPVPDRDSVHNLGSLRYDDIPSDVWYISEKDWDANGDGVYGDWRNDREAIAYTSSHGASIGRIPVRSPTDVEAYTEKVIAYETAYPEDGFAESFTYTCGVSMANYKADMLWDQNVGKVWADGSIARFFTDKTPWDSERPGDFDLSPKNWIERINAKSSGKMHMHGHGILTEWVLERHRRADANTVAQLKNEDAYLVMTTVSCFTGQFDGAQDPSITESLLRAPRAGAVLAVAPAREGVPVFKGGGRDPRDGVTQDGTTRLLTRFWCNGLEDNLTVGEAFARAKQDLSADAADEAGYHWVLSELNLLGDPTLDMRARAPVTPEVQAPKTLASDAGSVRITVGSPDLQVCAWKQGEAYQRATSDADGLVRFEFEGISAGELWITVSGPSVNTVSLTVEIE